MPKSAMEIKEDVIDIDAKVQNQDIVIKHHNIRNDTQ